MLHIVNQAPFSRSCLADCLRVCDAQAIVLLIEDGVYAAIAGSEAAQQIQQKTQRAYVLDADAAARGLTEKLDANFNVIDYAGFVQLCCEHASIHSWY